MRAPGPSGPTGPQLLRAGPFVRTIGHLARPERFVSSVSTPSPTIVSPGFGREQGVGRDRPRQLRALRPLPATGRPSLDPARSAPTARLPPCPAKPAAEQR